MRGVAAACVCAVLGLLIGALLASRSRGECALCPSGFAPPPAQALVGDRAVWRVWYRPDGTDSIYVEAWLGERAMPVMVDTGYAGPPVLNTSSLGHEEAYIKENGLDAWNALSLERKVRAVQRGRSAYGSAVRRAKGAGCVSFTSGCTMRLMGISSTQERAANLLLCRRASFVAPDGGLCAPMSSGGSSSDVWVTNHVAATPHILTMDYLRHAAPAVLDIASGTMRFPALGWEASRPAWKRASTRVSGGAYLLKCVVAGEEGMFTLDTGYGGTFALSASFAARARSGLSPTGSRLEQHGVHAERVRSSVAVARGNRIAGARLDDDLPVLCNSTDVDGADGYVGVGVLRMFEIAFAQKGVYLLYHGKGAPSSDFFSPLQ